MEKEVFAFIRNADLQDRDQRNKCFSIIISLINNAIGPLGAVLPPHNINPVILMDVLAHFQKDIKKYQNPNEFKLGGYLTFWIRKLKPFRKLDEFNLFTNELLGLALGLNIVYSTNIHSPEVLKEMKALPEDVWANLLYDLRYRPMSPSALANHFHLLYI